MNTFRLSQRRDSDMIPQMPPAPNRESLDDVLQYMERGLDCIMLEPTWGADISSLVGLYSTVHNYCTSQKAVGPSSSVGGAHREAVLLGSELYDFLTRYISRYLDQLRQQLQALSVPALLKRYLEEWTHFTNCAHIVHHIFRYLNRHWVKRELDEGKKDVYDVYTLHLVLWHKELLRPIVDMLSDSVARLIVQRRNGERIDGGAIKALIDIILSMDLDDTDPARPVRAVYRHILELPIQKVLDAFNQTIFTIYHEQWIIESFQRNTSQLEVEDKLNEIFFGPGYFQEQPDSLTNHTMLRLVTNDLVVVEVEQRVAEHSFLIQHLCAFFGEKIISRQYIPLPAVNEPVLRKVLDWCHHHKSDHSITTRHHNGWDQASPITSTTERNMEISEWDQKFFQVDQDMLFEIILAANYLDIKPLLNLGCLAVANKIKGRSPEEIRTTFNITNDFTPEEEEQMRREQDFMEDY